MRLVAGICSASLLVAIGCGARTPLDDEARTAAAGGGHGGSGGAGGADQPQESVQLAAGAFHTCAAPYGGELACWGSNREGQLGIEGVEQSQPARVVLPSPGQITSLAAGFRHTCAAVRDDFSKPPRLYCWGENLHGQLGAPTVEPFSTTPVEVPIPYGIADDLTSLAAGEDHTCAALNDGRTFCWGNNSQGQLGSGAEGVGPFPPQQVVGMDRVVRLAAGDFHTCAASDQGTWCFGQNFHGQLGNGNRGVDSAIPVLVATGQQFQLIASRGFFNLATAYEGRGSRVYGWGDDAAGVLGGSGSQSLPTQLTPIEIVNGLTAGLAHGCMAKWNDGFDTTNRVWCWGDNSAGQLGDGSTASRSEPAPTTVELDVYRVVAGTQHTCASQLSGELYCWGKNADGQCGSGAPSDLLVPTEVILP